MACTPSFLHAWACLSYLRSHSRSDDTRRLYRTFFYCHVLIRCNRTRIEPRLSYEKGTTRTTRGIIKTVATPHVHYQSTTAACAHVFGFYILHCLLPYAHTIRLFRCSNPYGYERIVCLCYTPRACFIATWASFILLPPFTGG